MRNRRCRWAASLPIMAAVALATVGVALGQAGGPAAKTGTAKGKAGKAIKGGLRVPAGAPPKKFVRKAADPFANPAPAAQGQPNAGANAWPFHFKFKISSFDATPLAAAYYPAQRNQAPVVLLVHEKGRLAKDFEDGIEDLKNRGLAQYLQDQGYAVLIFDMRGHGSNARKELGPRDGPILVHDLQAVYQFLVDRHNREEINLAKFGVVALGEGANLVAAWAATPGGAVSSEGRISDMGALVLISPAAEGFGAPLGRALAIVAPRIPVFLIAGERDQASLNPVKEAQPIVARQRQSKVEFFPTALHGYKLLRFQPKVADAIVSFFESTIKKLRLDEWEPRYNLTPVAYGEIELVPRKGGAEKGVHKFEPDAKKADAAAKKAEPAAEKKADGAAAEKKADAAAAERKVDGEAAEKKPEAAPPVPAKSDDGAKAKDKGRRDRKAGSKKQ